MRYRPTDGVWTDLEPLRFHRPPNCLVKAADIAYREIITEADLYAAGMVRRCLFTTTAGVQYYVELVPYVHPDGAADITLGVFVNNSDGTRDFTLQQEGRLINEAGVLVAASEEAVDVAGLLLGDYFTHIAPDDEQYEAFRCNLLEEGDFIWVIRNGIVYLDATAAVTAGDNLMSSATVAGEVETSTALDTTTAITLLATLKKHLTGAAFNLGCCLATALATIGAAGLVKVDLKLPPRRIRTN